MRLTHEEVSPASEHRVAKRYTIAVTIEGEATLVGCSETGPSVTFSVGCRKGEPC